MAKRTTRKNIYYHIDLAQKQLENCATHLGQIQDLAKGRVPKLDLWVSTIVGSLGMLSKLIGKMKDLFRGQPDLNPPAPEELAEGDGAGKSLDTGD